MKSMIMLIVAVFYAHTSFACAEFNFCPGERAISNDGYVVPIVRLVSPDVAVIQNNQGTQLDYQTQYLAKMSGCNSAHFCVGDEVLTADGHTVRIAGVFGCGSTDVAIPTPSTAGGYLRYASQNITKLGTSTGTGPGCM